MGSRRIPSRAPVLFQCSCLGSLLIGVKVVRLAEASTITRQLPELQLKKLTKLEQRKQSVARSRTHTALPNFSAATSAQPGPPPPADGLSPLPGHGYYVDRVSMAAPLRPSVAAPGDSSADSVDVELADIRSPSAAAAAAAAAANIDPLDGDFHVDDEEQVKPPPPAPAAAAAGAAVNNQCYLYFAERYARIRISGKSRRSC